MANVNEVTRAAYKGKNPLLLAAAELENGFDPARGWAGYGQWQQAGRQVLKGQHGTIINRVVMVTSRDGHERTTCTKRKVFHFDQIAAIDDLEPRQESAPRGEDAHLEIAYEDACSNAVR